MNIICIQVISPDAYFIRFSTSGMQTGKFSNDIASILFGTSHVIYHIKDILSECTLFVFTIYIAFFPNFTLTFQYSLEIWGHVLVADDIFTVTALRILALTFDPINLVVGRVIYIPIFSSLKKYTHQWQFRKKNFGSRNLIKLTKNMYWKYMYVFYSETII